jgi:superfamily II DNA helicase RecQ
VPIMALTATATPAVTRDIADSLGLTDPLFTRTTFDRPNLFLDVKPKAWDDCAFC